MNRAPSNESEEEEILPLGEEPRWRGEAPGEPGPPGVASGSSVAAASKSTAMPQEGQKRAVPGIALPQAGQFMIIAGVYHCPLPSSDSVERSFPRNASALSDARFREEVKLYAVLGARSTKPFEWSLPTADAGPMGTEWKGGVSCKTGYKIFDRYQDCGVEGLTDRSRRPYRYANKLPFQVENFILNVKREHSSWGARKIRERLIRRFSDIPIPAKSTIHAVLDRHGLVERRGRLRRRAQGTALSLGQRPNEL